MAVSTFIIKKYSLFSAKTLFVFVGLIVLTSQSIASKAQDIPETTGGAIGSMIGNLGKSLAEFQALSEQRRATINALQIRLETCGECEQKAEIENSLEHWRKVDAKVKYAEQSALASVGLGKYKSIAEVRAAVAEHIRSGPTIAETKYHRRYRQLINTYCSALATPPSGRLITGAKFYAMEQKKELTDEEQRGYDIWKLCAEENKYELVMAHQQMARRKCYQETIDLKSTKLVPGFNGEKYVECMLANDVSTNMCKFFRSTHKNHDPFAFAGGCPYPKPTLKDVSFVKRELKAQGRL